MRRSVRRLLASLIGLILLIQVAPAARAAFTPIGDAPAQYLEPNLVGVNPYPFNLNPSVLETLYGEANLRRIDDDLDRRFAHTGTAATMKVVAKFSGIGNQIGFFPPGSTSLHAVLRFRDSRYVGYNPEVVVSSSTKGIIDPAVSGLIFPLGLHRTVTSIPGRNTSGLDQMVTFEIIGAIGHPNNVIGNYVVAFEDNPKNDVDYQDVIAELSGVVPVPEPAGGTLTAWPAICLAISAARRSRNRSPDSPIPRVRSLVARRRVRSSPSPSSAAR
jgi:hypothetical protein